MQHIFKKSIKHKVVLITMLMSAIPLVLACIMFVLYFRNSYEKTTVQSLESLAKVLAENGSAALMFEDNIAGNELLASLKTNDQIVAAYFITSKNNIIAEHHRGSVLPEGLPSVPRADSLYFQNSYLHLFQSVTYRSDDVGTVYLKADLEQMHQKIAGYITSVIIFFILFSCLIFLFSLRIQKLITGPILHLADVARNFSLTKDYSLRAEAQSDDELGFLTERFNEMLGQIQNHEKALRKELTERKLAEKKLLTSLKEKEVLLKEIHHRVKNNLQIISSLLNLQTEYVKDTQAHQMFRESQNRVRSMALIHETLYRSEDLAKIDISEYIHSLVQNLFRSFRANQATIKLSVQVENVFLNINTAIPCGLIINELVSNSLKHAFPVQDIGKTDRSNKIKISLKKINKRQMELMVADNGISLPGDFDPKKTNTLGLELVNTLTEQLNGSVRIDLNEGTKFIIVFNH